MLVLGLTLSLHCLPTSPTHTHYIHIPSLHTHALIYLFICHYKALRHAARAADSESAAPADMAKGGTAGEMTL